MLHLIIIVLSAFQSAFEQNQSMAVFPWYGGRRPCARFPVNWAVVAMVVAVLPMMMKIGNLLANRQSKMHTCTKNSIPR